MKIGAVSYLNTKPLVFGLDRLSGIELSFDLPSRLADRLADGEMDVALVPVIEAITNPLYTVVSDACIACRGPVRSVKLFSRCQLSGIESVALDEGSRTSAALTRIILWRDFGVAPKFCPLPISADWGTTPTDAVLVIGDRAMHDLPLTHPFSYEIDLGEYWNDSTGLPFVFAVWAARPGADVELLDSILGHARDEGLKNVETIARRASGEHGFSAEQCRAYLTRDLYYFLGPREKMGLQLFLDNAKDQSLVDPNLSLQFYDCQAT